MMTTEEWNDKSRPDMISRTEANAMVAAALREAADYAGTLQDFGREEAIEAAILTLITPDAQAALDRVVAAEREEMVKAVWDEYQDSIVNKWTFRREHVQNAIARAAAIRKGGKRCLT